MPAPRAHDLAQLVADDERHERYADEAVRHLWDAVLTIMEAVGPRPAWQDSAACRGHSATMFSGQGESTAPARRLCATCPVQAECLTWALERPDQRGVCGGTSERERRRMRQAAA